MPAPRALLIAEAANPEWPSVPLVGYSHARALLEVVDGHLITQVRNVEALEKAGMRAGREYTALDSEVVAHPLWRGTELIRKLTGLGWTFETAMNVLPYYYFEQQLLRHFGAQIAEGRWDVVHRITPLSPTIPSIIGPFCAKHRVPFIWGPINGGVPWPPGFSEVQRREGEWLHYVRSAYRLLPGYQGTLDSAAALIAGSKATMAQLPGHLQHKVVYLPENAIDVARFPVGRSGPIRSPLRVAFVGRLVAYKGADMLIEATAELMRQGRVVLDIIGDGPERDPLRALCQRLGVTGSVRLEGWVDHRSLAARLLESDVFGFPSVREFGGGVVLEAMALGLVPVVADYAGPSELVTDATGYRVPMGRRDELIRGFTRRFEALVADPTPLVPMGERARARVLAHFTWPAKAAQVVQIYRWVRGQGPRPDFGMPFGEGEAPRA